MTPQPRAAIVGISGPILTDEERALFSAAPPTGLILFKRNIRDGAQLSDLVASLRATVPGVLLMVDQEGGRVARLRPPCWRAHPAAGGIGDLFRRHPEAGLRAAFLTGALIGTDCNDAGFDVVCAPVLDLQVPGADAVIGDRAYGADPANVAVLARAVAEGLLAAGIQPVGKHAPGHGRATLDSHLALPELEDVDEADLVPFRANAWLPWMMTAHIRYRRLDPHAPATLSRTVLDEVVRGRIGFANLLVSDDLAMHAVSGDPGMLAVASLAAGCDLALHCSGVLAETRSVLHAVPAPDAAARTRLVAAAAMARRRRVELDAAAMSIERDALLA
ncbi:beta-N-acetylhexosaminidase [Lichenicola sp.]|uniref:beta-N-acetylhexosaminidase n=1 Tax=Lichenicola sp. TaxID=2804529 RepID=UPI003B00F687